MTLIPAEIYDVQLFIVGGLLILLNTFTFFLAPFPPIRRSIIYLMAYHGISALYRGTHIGPPNSLIYNLRSTMFLFLALAAGYLLNFIRINPRLKAHPWVLPAFLAFTSLCGAPVLFNTTLNACFLVFLLPLTTYRADIPQRRDTALKPRSWIYWSDCGDEIATALVIIYTWWWGSTTGIALMCIHLMMLVPQTAYYLIPAAIIRLLDGGDITLVPYYLAHKSDRIEFYDIVSRYMNHRPMLEVVFGTGGLGSFPYWGPVLQTKAQFQLTPPRFWLSAHSDFLQTMFESGSVGIGLTAIVFFDVINNAEAHIKRTLLLILAASIFNFPLQVPLIILLAGYLVMAPKYNRNDSRPKIE